MKGKNFALDPMKEEQTTFSATNIHTEVWHKRLGHFNHTTVVNLQRMKLVQGLSCLESKVPDCRACQQGKQSRLPFKQSTWRATKKLQSIHMDVVGPHSSSSLNCSRSNKKVELENTQLKARRKKEKQTKAQNEGSSSLQRAHSRINFKVSPPKSQQQQFCKTRSPSKGRGGTPHKFLIKSPFSTNKFQVQIKNPPTVSISPTRPTRTKKTVQKNDGFVSGNSSRHQQCNSSLFEEFKKNLDFVATKLGDRKVGRDRRKRKGLVYVCLKGHMKGKDIIISLGVPLPTSGPFFLGRYASIPQDVEVKEKDEELIRKCKRIEV
ncbi:putative microtubule-binding protein TANGLED, partial [Mucuna pruriens]